MDLKKLLRMLLLGSAGVTLSACAKLADFTIPQKVELKTSAEFSVGLGDMGSFASALTENFNMAGMLESMRESMGDKVHLYDFDDGKDVLSYLVHLPLYELPLDFGTYIDSMDINGSLGNVGSGMNMDVNIKLPEGKITIDNYEIGKEYFKTSGATDQDMGPFEITFGTDTESKNGLSFGEFPETVKEISFENAVITIAIPLPEGWKFGSNKDFGGITGFTMGSIGDLEESEEPPKDGAEYIFYQEYKWTVKNLDIESSRNIQPEGKFEFTVPQGTIINSNCPKLVMYMTVDTLSSVTVDTSKFGFTMDKEQNRTELPGDMLQFVKEVTFFSSEADGKHYKSGPDETQGALAGGLGIKANVTNNLGDIPIKIESKVFNLEIEENISLDENGKENSWVTYKELDFANLKNKEGVIYDGEKYYVDLSVSIGDENGEATFKNMKMGQEYRLSLTDVGFEFDWDSMSINSEQLTQKGDVELSDFNFRGMLGGIGIVGEDDIDSIQISELPVYFYVQNASGDVGGLSELMSDMTMTGNIDFIYKTEQSPSEQTEPLLKDNVNIINTVIPWPDDVSETVSKKSPVYDYLNKEKSSFTIDNMADIINANPTEMKINYEITPSSKKGGSLGTMKIFSYMMDPSASKGAATISIDMAAILPLKLKISEDIDFNLSQLTGGSDEDGDSGETGGDLLGRDSPGVWAKFAPAVDKIAVSYRLSNFIMQGSSHLVLLIDDTHEGTSGYSGIRKEFELKTSGESEFKLIREDINGILTNYFNPSISFGLRKGDMFLSRKAVNGDDVMKMPVTLSLKMNPDYPIQIFPWELGGTE